MIFNIFYKTKFFNRVSVESLDLKDHLATLELKDSLERYETVVLVKSTVILVNLALKVLPDNLVHMDQLA